MSSSRFKKPLLIFLIGLLINIPGAWMKITHQPYADFFLTVGFTIQMLGVLYGILILLKTKNTR